MREPLRLVWVIFEVEAGDEGFVSANNDHHKQVGDHDHINQAKHDEHYIGFADVRGRKSAHHQMA